MYLQGQNGVQSLIFWISRLFFFLLFNCATSYFIFLRWSPKDPSGVAQIVSQLNCFVPKHEVKVWPSCFKLAIVMYANINTQYF